MIFYRNFEEKQHRIESRLENSDKKLKLAFIKFQFSTLYCFREINFSAMLPVKICFSLRLIKQNSRESNMLIAKLFNLL